MHQSVMTWLAERGAQFGVMRAWSVLEVGSYDENGSARTIFEHAVRRYWGIDKRAGRGVDEVTDILDFAGTGNDDYYDLVICTEMLEHDIRPWLTLPAISTVLRSGGHLLLTARGFDDYGGYPRHPCPGDYWRFTADSFRVLLGDAGLTPIEIMMDPEIPGVFGHATKPSQEDPPVDLPPPPDDSTGGGGVREPRRPVPPPRELGAEAVDRHAETLSRLADS